MKALSDVWVHRRPKGWSYGPLEGTARVRGARGLAAPWTHVLAVLTRNEFRARYRSQALGAVWSLISPLVQMAILSVIFSHVPAFRSATASYPIYLLFGVVVWQFFSTSITSATQSFLTHADVVKRTVFSRQLLPIAAALSYGINLATELALVLLVAPFWHAIHLSRALACVPVILAVLLLLVIGLVLITSVLNVVYRDVAYLVTTGLTLLYWLTPIIYPISFVPEPYATIIHFNPVASILMALRGCIMDGAMPTTLMWIGMLGPTLVIVLVGALIFRSYERLVLDYV